jgi:ABC-type antimicrobial peptide transport system permease subunit
VVIINQAMAKRYWPNEDPLGKRITFEDNPKEKDWLTVVGVVGDVKDKPDSPAAEAAFWWPHLQAPHLKMSVVIRANGDPALLADAFRDRVKQLDPTLAVANVRQMDKIADASIATPRLAFVLVGLFAGLAIVLAAIGTYGVIAYSVSQRIPEFSLRMALGAPRGDVLRLVMGQAARLAVAGSVAGVCVALALARVLRSLIYNVSPADPVTYVAVGAGVIAIAMLACYLPARRAMQASPMAALRAE